MTRVRRDTHLPYYTENPRKNLHLLGKLTFPSNASALLGKVVIFHADVGVRVGFSFIQKVTFSLTLCRISLSI